MWRELGISEKDWQQTPQSVRAILVSLRHQLRLFEIRHAAYEKEIASVRQQMAIVDDLKAEMAELRERLGQNSQHSSKPPSSDPPFQKRKPPSAPRGRKRGGQPGHEGHTRRIRPAAEVDHIVDLRPTSCARCRHLLLGDDPQPERHQVSEVPRVKAEVTEYWRHCLRCLVCGAENRAEWPVGRPSGSFGPHAQAIVSYLSGRLGASHRDVAEALAVLHGLEISLGSVSAIQRQMSGALQEPVEAAQQFVRRQKVQYVDETGWRESGRQHWLWVNATAEVTAFRILSGRSGDDAKRVIGTDGQAIIGTDRYSAYHWLNLRRRQICWAHLIRDFQALVDRGGESAVTGQALLKEADRLFDLWHQVRDGRMNPATFRRAMEPIQQRVKDYLRAGARSTQAKTRHTCANILKVETALWSFVREEGVEPTNNEAERALRRAVLWRRKSFGTRSEAGSRFVERILTVVTSLRQQGRDVLEYLTAACRAMLGDRMSSGLVPDSS